MKRKLFLLIASIILCGSSVYAQSNNHWNPEPFYLPANCNIWWSATLDGEALASPDIEVAAFVDDECRATARMGYLENTVGQMQVPHSGVVVITFKMYDHATQTEYENCSTTITTSADEEVLGVVNQHLVPVVFAFNSPTPFGPSYPWTAPIGVYPNNMSVTAEIQINGVPVTETERWELAAFCGDDCRGDNKGLGAGPFGPLMYLTVYGESGDVMNFYLYDLDNDEVYPGICSATVTFIPGESYGYPWEPFVLNFVTIQTFTKDINPYTEVGGYYLIASPIGTVDVTAVENLITESDYDFYSFDQSGEGDETHPFLEWRNYEAGEFTQLEAGKGYLYANSEFVRLTFIGAPYSGDGVIELDYNPDARLVGWNLVGNPYADMAYVNRDFYTMKGDGSEIIAATGNSVEAMEGIFVVAEGEGETVTFSTNNPVPNKGLVLNLSQDRGVIDRAIVRFGQGRKLPKFMLNENGTKVYIPQGSDEFAVVRSNRTGEIPVNFEPAEDGIYTISVNAEGLIVRYLHLIDKMEGVDIDLLRNPSYQFKASTNDRADRFVLSFSTNSGIYKEVFVTGVHSDSFSFYNNGNWIINNEGEAMLQVIDVNGHIFRNESINGNASIHLDVAHGVYMLRLINGDNVKVQKIVVQ